MAWLGLLATIGWNYHQHLRGRPTICSVTRRVLPRWAFLPLGIGGAVGLGIHVWRGYPASPVLRADRRRRLDRSKAVLR